MFYENWTVSVMFHENWTDFDMFYENWTVSVMFYENWTVSVMFYENWTDSVIFYENWTDSVMFYDNRMVLVVWPGGVAIFEVVNAWNHTGRWIHLIVTIFLVFFSLLHVCVRIFNIFNKTYHYS